MKSVITFLFSICFLIPAFAQDEEPVVKESKAQEKIRVAKIAYITERLGLTPEEAEKFWPIYNEFDQKRKELRVQVKDQRKNLDPGKSKEDTDKAAIALHQQFRQQELDLEKDYSKRLLNVVSAQKVRALPKTEKEFTGILIRKMQQQQARQERQQLQRDRKDQRPNKNN